MTVLSRLFRQATPPPPKTLDEKLAELPSQSPESLVAVALGDDDETLRVAAIRLLGPGDTLRSLAGLTGDAAPPAALRRAAVHDSASCWTTARSRSMSCEGRPSTSAPCWPLRTRRPTARWPRD